MSMNSSRSRSFMQRVFVSWQVSHVMLSAIFWQITYLIIATLTAGQFNNKKHDNTPKLQYNYLMYAKCPCAQPETH